MQRVVLAGKIEKAERPTFKEAYRKECASAVRGMQNAYPSPHKK